MRALTFVVFVWMVCAGVVLAWNAGAHARPLHATWTATIACDHMAEDTAAHLRLVRYHVTPDDGLVLRYRCKHNGY